MDNKGDDDINNINNLLWKEETFKTSIYNRKWQIFIIFYCATNFYDVFIFIQPGAPFVGPPRKSPRSANAPLSVVTLEPCGVLKPSRHLNPFANCELYCHRFWFLWQSRKTRFFQIKPKLELQASRRRG